MISNIVASDGEFPIGLDNDLIAFFSSLAVHVLFYIFLKAIGKTISWVVSTLRLLGFSSIPRSNLFNHVTALLLFLLAGHFLAFTALYLAV